MNFRMILKSQDIITGFERNTGVAATVLINGWYGTF